MLWSLISRFAAPYMRQVTELAKAYLESFDYKRMEMYIRSTFAMGHKWAVMLGFESEALLKNFKPYADEDYRDEHLYVRLF